MTSRGRRNASSGRSVATAIGVASVVASVAVLRLGTAAPDGAPAVEVVRSARVDSAVSQTWTCAAGSGVDNARHELVVTNLADSSATLTVRGLSTERLVASADPTAGSGAGPGESTTAPAAQPSSTVPSVDREVVAAEATATIDVAASSVQVVDLEEIGMGGAVAFDAAGGLLEVEHAVSIDGRRTQSPCVTAVSERWIGAGVGTPRGTELSLSLANPGVSPATVSVEFATSDGVRTPAAFSSVQIDPGSSVELDVDAVVQRQDDLGFEVRAKRGTVVAEAFERDGSGVRLVEVSPSTASRWIVPVGVTGEQVGETIVVFNPGSRRTTAEVAVVAADADLSLVSEPFELSIAPFATARLDLAEESRVEPERAHMIEVVSQDSEVVVAQRQRIDGPASDAAIDRPPARSGSWGTLGSSIRAREWTAGCPAGSESGARCVVTIANPGASSVEVDILGIGGGTPQALTTEPAKVAAGEVRVIELELPDAGGWSAVVRASGPVVVGRLVSWGDPLGVANSLAVPTRRNADFGS